MRKQKGFSLIELLIVVAIILIIAAIAIPNLLRARMSANESSAVGSIRTLVTAQVSYSAACTAANEGFGTLANLGQPALNPAVCPGPMGYIDAQLTAGAKSGYAFTVNDRLLGAGANPAFIDFEVEGHPLQAGSTGNRAFCATQQGTVLANPAGTAVVTRAACDQTAGLQPVAN